MKKLIFLFVSIFMSLTVLSQVDINFDKFDTVAVAKYQFTGLGVSQCYIQMSFCDSKIYNPKILEALKDKKIDKIELIYTDYPLNKNLANLNKKRLLELYKLSSQIFEDTTIKWTIVKQNGYTKDDVYNYFHGFSITYSTPEKAKIDYSNDEGLHQVVFGETPPKDSTVLKVLERNNDWTNMLIVCDFTGSMSTYVSQVLLWYYLKIKEEKIKSFVFFNDGNLTPDADKIIGKTGGIYDTDVQNIDSVLNTAIQTISSGTGGDGPENDIEAILYGLEKYPNTESIVLIADNGANMRDTVLISKIKKPIKVILCGSDDELNIQFLNLAIQTGGSIHTIEEDLNNLISLNEGEEIKIGNSIYVVENGKFKFVKKVSGKLYSM